MNESCDEWCDVQQSMIKNINYDDYLIASCK